MILIMFFVFTFFVAGFGFIKYYRRIREEKMAVERRLRGVWEKMREDAVKEVVRNLLMERDLFKKRNRFVVSTK